MVRISLGCVAAGKAIVFLCMLGMTASICLQVFFRYIVGNSISWSEEFSRYLMIWMGFAGASVALRQGSHVAIDYFCGLFGTKVKWLLRVAARTLIAIFLFFLVKEGWALSTFFMGQKSPAMRISMFWAYAATFTGGLFMAIHLFVLLMEDCGLHRSRRPGTMAGDIAIDREPNS
jgi:TRAP-type C4-dicarboxylate transport system permease small subunit